MKMDFDAKITFENGDVLYSHFLNQDPDEIADFYIGHKFNLGFGKDLLKTCIKIEFIYGGNL